MILMAELNPGAFGLAFTGIPEFAAARKEHDLTTSADPQRLYLWKSGGTHSRTAEQLREFLDLAGPLLGRAVAAAEGR
jgi:hypothetical protein